MNKNLRDPRIPLQPRQSKKINIEQPKICLRKPADVDDRVELGLKDVLVVGGRLQNFPGVDFRELEPDGLRLHPDW